MKEENITTFFVLSRLFYYRKEVTPYMDITVVNPMILWMYTVYPYKCPANSLALTIFHRRWSIQSVNDYLFIQIIVSFLNYN